MTRVVVNEDSVESECRAKVHHYT